MDSFLEYYLPILLQLCSLANPFPFWESDLFLDSFLLSQQECSKSKFCGDFSAS